MGLPANFWTSTYIANYFKHDFSSITDGGQTNYGVSTWKSNLLTNCGDIVQIEGAQNEANTMHNHNHGYWYLRGQTTGKDLPITFLQVSGQTVLLPTEQLPPTDQDDTIYAESHFADAGGSTGARVFYIQSGTTETADVRHYQPYAWKGTAAEVIGCIVSQATGGFQSDIIHTDAFDDSYDQQLLWGTDDEDCLVYVRREIGETMADTIKRVARHCKDILCIQSDGNLSLMPRDAAMTPTNTSLDKDDGVLAVSWRYAWEHLANTCWAMHGQFFWYHRTGGSAPDQATWRADAQWCPRNEYDSEGIYTDQFIDSTSVTAFGTLYLGDTEAEMTEDNRTVRLPVYHLPYFLREERKAKLMEQLTGPEAELRKEITVTQDFRGIDADIGHKIVNVELTGDGDTIADMRVIKKIIDLDKLTVTSVLLEEG